MIIIISFGSSCRSRSTSIFCCKSSGGRSCNSRCCCWNGGVGGRWTSSLHSRHVKSTIHPAAVERPWPQSNSGVDIPAASVGPAPSSRTPSLPASPSWRLGQGYQEADCDCSTMGYARPLPRLSVKRPLLSPKATLRIFIPQKDTTFNCRAPRNNYANEITRGGRGAAKRHFLQHQFSQVIVGGSLQFYREAGAAGSRARQPPTHPRPALLHIQVPAAHHEDRMTIMDKNARQPNENYHQCLSDKI